MASPASKYWFGQRSPESAEGWFEFYKQTGSNGALDKKSKELVAVGVSAALRCRHCLEAHIKDAQKAGASREEISDALMTTALIASGATLFWAQDIYDEYLGDGQ